MILCKTVLRGCSIVICLNLCFEYLQIKRSLPFTDLYTTVATSIGLSEVCRDKCKLRVKTCDRDDECGVPVLPGGVHGEGC